MNKLNPDYDVFYDETNNYRKVFINGQKLNIASDSNFVLAGITTKEENNSPIWNDFYKKIGIFNYIPELKSKYVFSGDILTCLSSKRLNNFLHLLKDNEISIHFLNLNILYWAVIDVVESVLCIRNTPNHLQRRATAVLLEVARCNKNKFVEILANFNYPDVKDRRNFVSSIGCLIKEQMPNIEQSAVLHYYDIIGLLCACEVYKNEKLEFVEDGEKGVILDNFLNMYLHIPMKYPQLKHFFDEETQIKNMLKHDSSYFGSISKQIFFKESKSDIRIQISDVVAGLLGKYFTFISNTTIDELKKILLQLTCTQKENLSVLRDLLQRSDSFSLHLSMRIDSLHNCLKSDMFLLSD